MTCNRFDNEIVGQKSEQNKCLWIQNTFKDIHNIKVKQIKCVIKIQNKRNSGEKVCFYWFLLLVTLCPN